MTPDQTRFSLPDKTLSSFIDVDIKYKEILHKKLGLRYLKKIESKKAIGSMNHSSSYGLLVYNVNKNFFWKTKYIESDNYRIEEKSKGFQNSKKLPRYETIDDEAATNRARIFDQIITDHWWIYVLIEKTRKKKYQFFQ